MKRIQPSTAENLRKILEVNAKINTTLNINKLLGMIMSTASEVMRSEAASLMLIDENSNELVFKVALGERGGRLQEKFRVKMGEGIAGTVAKTKKSVIVEETQKDKRFAKRFDEAIGFTSKSILCVPMKVKGKTIGVLEAINPRGRRCFVKEDQEVFEAFADQAAIAIENARMHEEIIKQEKTKQELKIAHEIQQNFLPNLSGTSFGIDIAARNKPAREVGGDFYDVIKLDPDRIAVAIGDVSGKGVPAALFMVHAISKYRYLAPHAHSTTHLLTCLNQTLAGDSTFGMFITFLLMIVDRKKRVLEYSSAGHHPILRRKQSSGTVESLTQEGGLPIGLAEDAQYQQNSIPLESGDVLFLYTDGIIEARNKAREEYQMTRLEKAGQTAQANAQAYADALIQSVESFTDGAEQHDDLTAVVSVIP